MEGRTAPVGAKVVVYLDNLFSDDLPAFRGDPSSSGMRILAAMPLVCLWACEPTSDAQGDWLVEEASLESTASWNYGWAQAGRSPRRTGYDPHERLLSRENAPRLKVAWSHSWNAIYLTYPAQPIVWRGVVFVRTFAAREKLLAFEAETGAARWVDAQTDTFVGFPAAGYGRLFAMNAYGFTGMSVKTGEELWRHGPNAADDATSDPLALDDQAIVLDYSEGGGQGTTVTSFDGAKGTRRWQTHFSEGRHLSDPAAADGVIYVASAGGRIQTLAANDGSVRWAFEVPNETFGSPAVLKGRLFVVSGTAKLFSFDTLSGREYWFSRVPGIVDPQRSPVVDGESVYVAGDNDLGRGIHVSAFDFFTGRRRYTRTVGTGDHTGDLGGANGVLYFGSSDGHLYGLDTEDGSLLVSVFLGGPVSAPVISNGHLFVATASHVYALTVPLESAAD